MQFNLRTLLIVVTLAAVVCGTFVGPPIFVVPILCLILWTSPAFWLSAAFVSRGPRQAFFIGASVAGIAPYMTAVMMSIFYYAEWIDDGDIPNILERNDDPWGIARMAIAVYIPGVCSAIGGALAVVAFRFHARPPNRDPPSNGSGEDASSAEGNSAIR